MVTAARCYHCAIFALGALTGMCLSFFSAVPFVYGIAVGFALYELHPEGVRRVRNEALAQMKQGLGRLQDLRLSDLQFVSPDPAAGDPHQHHASPLPPAASEKPVVESEDERVQGESSTRTTLVGKKNR